MPDNQLVRFWSQLKTTRKRNRNPSRRHLILPLLWSLTGIGSLNMLASCRIKVPRMMVGGMKVVGIYVWASEAVFKKFTVLLCQTVKRRCWSSILFGGCSG